MQFYTKLRYAKIIIFFPRCVYLQRLLRSYYPDAIYFLACGTSVIFYHYYIRKRFCALYEFWSKRFLWHLAFKSQNAALAVSALAHNR
jgi:hypothetical protein